MDKLQHLSIFDLYQQSISIICPQQQNWNIDQSKCFYNLSFISSDLLSLHQILVFANKRQSICSLILFVVQEKHLVYTDIG